jgi:hypothetical protein
MGKSDNISIGGKPTECRFVASSASPPNEESRFDYFIGVAFSRIPYRSGEDVGAIVRIAVDTAKRLMERG